MDKAYVDLAALYEMEQAGAFFVTRAKENMVFEVIETNYSIDEKTGLSNSIENGGLSRH